MSTLTRLATLALVFALSGASETATTVCAMFCLTNTAAPATPGPEAPRQSDGAAVAAGHEHHGNHGVASEVPTAAPGRPTTLSERPAVSVVRVTADHACCTEPPASTAALLAAPDVRAGMYGRVLLASAGSVEPALSSMPPGMRRSPSPQRPFPTRPPATLVLRI